MNNVVAFQCQYPKYYTLFLWQCFLRMPVKEAGKYLVCRSSDLLPQIQTQKTSKHRKIKTEKTPKQRKHQNRENIKTQKTSEHENVKNIKTQRTLKRRKQRKVDQVKKSTKFLIFLIALYHINLSYFCLYFCHLMKKHIERKQTFTFSQLIHSLLISFPSVYTSHLFIFPSQEKVKVARELRAAIKPPVAASILRDYFLSLISLQIYLPCFIRYRITSQP